MIDPSSISAWFRYNDWADTELLRAATPLSDSQLDRPFAMGVGSLRKTLLHIWAGESVWIARAQGRTETPWPNQEEKVSVAILSERFRIAWSERAVLVESLQPDRLGRSMVYRDSKGSLFQAPLADMLRQMFIHSLHHRAQAANMLRIAAGVAIDLDYMYWIRKPAN